VQCLVVIFEFIASLCVPSIVPIPCVYNGIFQAFLRNFTGNSQALLNNRIPGNIRGVLPGKGGGNPLGGLEFLQSAQSSGNVRVFFFAHFRDITLRGRWEGFFSVKVFADDVARDKPWIAASDELLRPFRAFLCWKGMPCYAVFAKESAR